MMFNIPHKLKLICILPLLVLVSLSSYAQTPTANVNVTSAIKKYIAPKLEVPGSVVSRNDARIATEVAGRVLWVAEIGSKVSKGQTLAQIDDRFLQLQLRSNNAAIKRLQANINYQQQNVSRLQNLTAQQNISVSQLEEAESRLAMLQQDLRQAKIDHDRTQQQINDSNIKAPFNGHIVERLITPGEFATIGNAIIRLTETDQLEARVRVPVNLEPHLTPKLMLSVSHAGQIIQAPIRTVVPVADEVARTFEIRVSLSNSGWIVGTPVKVLIPSAQAREVVAVPRDALILRSESIYVFKINEDNTAQRIAIQTGSANGRYIEIIGNITEGDRIVIRGGEQLRDGQAVLIETIT